MVPRGAVRPLDKEAVAAADAAIHAMHPELGARRVGSLDTENLKEEWWGYYQAAREKPPSAPSKAVGSATVPCPLCKAKTLTLSCGHNRSYKHVLPLKALPPSGKGFQVISRSVPPEKVTATLTYQGTPCPAHKAEPLRAEGVEKQKNVSAKEVLLTVDHGYPDAVAAIGGGQLAPLLDYLWLPNVKPRRLTLSEVSCNPPSDLIAVVEVFPHVKWDVRCGYSWGETTEETKSALGYDNLRKQDTNEAQTKLKASKGFYVGGSVEFGSEKLGLDVSFRRTVEDLIRVVEQADQCFSAVLKSRPAEKGCRLVRPNIQLSYTIQLVEDDTGPGVQPEGTVKIAGDPIVGFHGSIDIIDLVIQAAGAATGVGMPVARAILWMKDRINESETGQLSAILSAGVEFKADLTGTCKGGAWGVKGSAKGEIPITFRFTAQVGYERMCLSVKAGAKLDATTSFGLCVELTAQGRNLLSQTYGYFGGLEVTGALYISLGGKKKVGSKEKDSSDRVAHSETRDAPTGDAEKRGVWPLLEPQEWPPKDQRKATPLFS